MTFSGGSEEMWKQVYTGDPLYTAMYKAISGKWQFIFKYLEV